MVKVFRLPLTETEISRSVRSAEFLKKSIGNSCFSVLPTIKVLTTRCLLSAVRLTQDPLELCVVRPVV